MIPFAPVTDTINILSSLKAELEIAKAEYEHNPTVKQYNEIRFMESKIVQYTERVEKKMEQS